MVSKWWRGRPTNAGKSIPPLPLSDALWRCTAPGTDDSPSLSVEHDRVLNLDLELIMLLSFVKVLWSGWQSLSEMVSGLLSVLIVTLDNRRKYRDDFCRTFKCLFSSWDQTSAFSLFSISCCCCVDLALFPRCVVSLLHPLLWIVTAAQVHRVQLVTGVNNRTLELHTWRLNRLLLVIVSCRSKEQKQNA